MLMIPSMAQAQDVENKESPNLLVSEVAKKNNDIEIIEVSYGYSSVEKSDLTGAISTVKLEDVIDLPAGNVM